MNDNTIVCRCEDITLKELRDLIKEGYTTLDEIKRALRLGMGPCQGNICLDIAAREICKMTDKTMEEIKMPRKRPPVLGIKMSELAGDTDEE